MAASLGEKIKSLRKALKITQTELAGSEMTKSMLSQIENNLAMPSMKNLQYLASRLGKPASYFLEENETPDSLPSEEIHEELKIAAQLIKSGKQEDALIKLDAMLTKYALDHDSKLYADFLSKYGECLIDLNRCEEGEIKLKEAVDIYKSKFLFVEAARTYTILTGTPWNNFDYHKCMLILDEALEIYNNSINKDSAFEIETLYIRSILYAGLDQLEESVKATEKALTISKQTNIYYRSDELYKNLAVMNAFLGKLEHFELHMEKGRQFAIFTENHNILASIDAVTGIFYNQMGEPKKALDYMDKALHISNNNAHYAYIEKAKAYYMLEEYQKAMDAVRLVKYPTYTPFKYDYLHIWSSKIYEGLILSKMGKAKEAVDAIKLGIEKMEVVKESKALAFAYKSLSEVYSDMGDFERAFAVLKKANEIEEVAKVNKLYY